MGYVKLHTHTGTGCVQSTNGIGISKSVFHLYFHGESDRSLNRKEQIIKLDNTLMGILYKPVKNLALLKIFIYSYKNDL